MFKLDEMGITLQIESDLLARVEESSLRLGHVSGKAHFVLVRLKGAGEVESEREGEKACIGNVNESDRLWIAAVRHLGLTWPNRFR